MSNELLNTLEEKVNRALETIEGLKQENETLKAEISRLVEEKTNGESKMNDLIGRLSGLENEQPQEHHQEHHEHHHY